MDRLRPDEQTMVYRRPEDYSTHTASELELQTVGVQQFAQGCSKYLRSVVEKDLTVIITNRGRPVAQLGPIHPKITTEIDDG